MSEATLIESCKNGDRLAFELLYRRYASSLYTCALRYVSNRHHAEDVLQEALIKVFQSIKTFQYEGNFEGWLKRIVIRTAINDYHKEKKHEAMLNVEGVSYWSQQDTEILEQLSSEQIMVLIQQLPQGYRLVFNLYEIEGYSHQEIAEALNISESTSKSQLFKAKAKLKFELQKMGVHYYERVG
jgi:RNA polymerase sigma factor (sigma-70 family)